MGKVQFLYPEEQPDYVCLLRQKKKKVKAKFSHPGNYSLHLVSDPSIQMAFLPCTLKDSATILLIQFSILAHVSLF